jgi:hypothetical protein
MADKTTVFTAIQEVKELKDLFERIKADTEEFIRRAKALSETGAHEAKDLVEAVKNNWQSVLAGMGGVSGLASFISGALKSDPQSSGNKGANPRRNASAPVPAKKARNAVSKAVAKKKSVKRSK